MSERVGVAARDRRTMAGDGCLHLATFQPVRRMILIVDHQIEKHARQGGERGQEPGGKTVGIHCDPHHRSGLRRIGAEIFRHRQFQEPDILGMAGQPGPGPRRLARLAAPDERGAHLILQRADALRDRRGRHPQRLRCALERTVAKDGGKRLQAGGIKH